MQYLLFEDHTHFDLLPFTFTRPVWDLRVGIFTNRERWGHWVTDPIGTRAFGYLRNCFDSAPIAGPAIWINGALIPDPELLRLLQDLPPHTFVETSGGQLLGAHFSADQLPAEHDGLLSADFLESIGIRKTSSSLKVDGFRQLPDLFALCQRLIALDFPFAVAETPSVGVTDPHSRVYGADNLYVHPSASIKAAIINAEDGPIYVGPEASIQEGAVVRRSHALGRSSSVGVGAKLRGDSSLGPYCKVAGELTNSVLMGYSNKGHEGYLGNAVLGHWCNLGADTNASNLKNNYSSIKQWHYPSDDYQDTGLQFCGLMMGDHSKCGINTMFNTATVVGVSANIFGSGFPPKYIPSFSWGGADGFQTYQLEKALAVACSVMSRRDLVLDGPQEQLLRQVFAITADKRT